LATAAFAGFFAAFAGAEAAGALATLARRAGAFAGSTGVSSDNARWTDDTDDLSVRTERFASTADGVVETPSRPVMRGT
jgi:hypothetical protein